MQELQLAMDVFVQANPEVGLWMNWMMFVNALSILFIWKHKPARIVLAAFILLMPLGLIIFKMTGDIHLLGFGHILLWTPLVWYLVKNVTRKASFSLLTPYGLWIVALLTTMVVSLVFDIRDFVLILAGLK